ncbi:MAG: pseudouridine synthase [Saprospiraceae bacterium]
MPLEILYQDEYLIAINKPAGLLTHRSPIANDATEFAVQKLRDQIGQVVFPVHRLDRKTSGVLLFALSNEVNSQMQQLFSERKTHKIYHAVVRGFAPIEERIDYALVNEKGNEQSAVSEIKTLERFDINVPFGKHSTSRYSLVKLIPETGRFHQLRKHAAHIFHPIIGDRPHGCNKQNRLWKEKWGMTRMLLHATELSFDHPVSGQTISIQAPFDKVFNDVLEMLRKERINL